MTRRTATEIASEAYTAFRKSFRDVGAPPHWEQLTDREKRAFECVAQWGVDEGRADGVSKDGKNG